MISDPPGPRPHPWGIPLVAPFRRNPLVFLQQLAADYGDIACARIGPLHIVLLNHPDYVHEVLVTRRAEFPKLERHLRVLRQMTGNSIFNSDGELWARQRRLVRPVFQPRRMARYAEHMVQHTQRMLSSWSSDVDVDMVAAMTRLTLEIICKTMFSLELSDAATDIPLASRIRSDTFLREMGELYRLPDGLPLRSKRRKRWALNAIDALIRQAIRERRASPAGSEDLLSLLLTEVDDEGDGTGMSDEQARDEAVTLFLAGHDSTAAALSWIWYVIATHGDVQHRMITEIDQVIGNRLPDVNDLANMPYLDRVMKECLRLYPPTWCLVAREAASDIVLQGYRIRKKSWIYVSPYVMHRNPSLFDDPDRFDPSRFTNENFSRLPPHAYMPFGAGPRLCVGKTFSLVELPLIVTTVLQRFSIGLSPQQGADVEPEPLLAIRPRGGLLLRVYQRKPSSATPSSRVASV